MVKLALYLKATLSGVTDLRPQVDADAPTEYYYAFSVSCTSCREVHGNRVHVSAHERSPLGGSRGDAHFVWHCKSCGRESSASLADDGAFAPYTADDAGTAKAVLAVECRGCEFVDFSADGPWRCTGTGNGARRQAARFDGVELGEGEWYDYDDAAGAEVSIVDVEWTIGRQK